MARAATSARFRHDAFVYADDGEYVAGTLNFVREGLENDEPVLVAAPSVQIGLIRDGLGDDARRVGFEDMTAVGANPARIIPFWRRFVDEHGGRPVRGIGQPIWAGRTSAELIEAQRHEALINLAFAGANAAILCPYDRTALDPSVIDEAARSHPTLFAGAVCEPSLAYLGIDRIVEPFDAPLPEPPVPPETLQFDGTHLDTVRSFVIAIARRQGLGERKAGDAVLAVNEIATNSIRYGGGAGELAVWADQGALIFQIRDRGGVKDPLAGRVQPVGPAEGGFGLWLANQVCDLVQIRTMADGSVVRLWIRHR